MKVIMSHVCTSGAVARRRAQRSGGRLEGLQNDAGHDTGVRDHGQVRGGYFGDVSMCVLGHGQLQRRRDGVVRGADHGPGRHAQGIDVSVLRLWIRASADAVIAGTVCPTLIVGLDAVIVTSLTRAASCTSSTGLAVRGGRRSAVVTAREAMRITMHASRPGAAIPRSMPAITWRPALAGSRIE
jgi:hypothetical protein